MWAAALCTLSVGAAIAQPFPNRSVTIVVPYSAGGASDGLARQIAEKMRVQLHQPVIVENRPGAGTTIASSYVARAKPDGYTVLFAASSFGVAPALYKNAGYDPIKDFHPLSLLASVTHVLAVNPAVPVQSVSEFVEWVKHHPGNVNYASVGVGTTTHLEAELFKKMAGINMVQVPYKGSQAALPDLVAGRVQAMFDAYATAAPLAKEGRIRILGVTTERPSMAAPDIPTIAAQGVPGFDVMTWMGLLVPAGTPQDAVQTLSGAVDAALADPAVRTSLEGLGFEVIGYGPQRFADYLAQDVNKWSAFIREEQIVVE
ncbi:tripartite tricarboxylate transporter substrate binding protein [Bordetella muralis]